MPGKAISVAPFASVYDDTLREAVPDDFLNLIGKLSYDLRAGGVAR